MYRIVLYRRTHWLVRRMSGHITVTIAVSFVSERITSIRMELAVTRQRPRESRRASERGESTTDDNRVHATGD